MRLHLAHEHDSYDDVQATILTLVEGTVGEWTRECYRQLRASSVTSSNATPPRTQSLDQIRARPPAVPL